MLAGSAEAGSSRDTLAAMGLVYTGLKHVAGGPCGVLYQIDMPGYPRCTHGPDPAPPGVDVRRTRSLADLMASVPARALFSASPTSSLVPCTGDGTAGARVQAIYAHPPGSADRFAEIAPMIKEWASQVDETYSRSAAETGGVRHIRFVTTNCDLTVLDVVARSDSVDHTFSDLEAKGFTRADRKYLVWMDADEICGIGESYDDARVSQNNQNNGPAGVPGMMARIDEGCWGEYTNLARGSTEAHELTHTLGAVLSGAPHATDYGHCWDAYDVMCYEDGPGTTLENVCSFTHQVLLDCNSDDYFSTSPPAGSWLATHWNTANNKFLVGAGATTSDTQAPVVHATAVKAKRNTVAKLRFSVSDDSGKAKVQGAVFRGQKQLKRWAPEQLTSGNYYVTWRVPSKAETLDFCVAGEDASGNTSETVCASLRVT